MGTSIAGPSMVDLELLFQTDNRGVSLAIMVNTFGYMSGAFLTGLVFDR